MNYKLIKADAKNLPMEDESVQCVVTSPPYWGLRQYNGNQGTEPFGLESTLKMYVEHSIDILREIRRVLKPDGVVFWVIDDSYAGGGNYRGTNENTLTAKQRSNKGAHGELAIGRTGVLPPTLADKSVKAKSLCLIPQRIALAALDDGWLVRSDIIWNKPNPMPESVRDRFTAAYEHIFMFTKCAKYFWDAQACQEPAVLAGLVTKLGPKAFSRGQQLGMGVSVENLHGNALATEYKTKETRNMRNVWTFPTQPFKGSHVATFPEEIPRRCIRAATKVGDTVLDPFCGSGTTGKVALELGRNFIGTDLEYQEMAQQRIETAVIPETSPELEPALVGSEFD